MSANWNLDPLDLSEFETGDETARKHFVQSLGEAFISQGFAFVTGHKTEANTIREYYRAVADLVCGTSAEELQRHELVKDGIERGYVSSPSGGLKPSVVTLKNATEFLFVSGLKLAFRGGGRARVNISNAHDSVTMDLPDVAYEAANPQSELTVQFQNRTLKFRRLSADRYAVLAPDDKHGWITGLGHNIYPAGAKDFAALSQAIYRSQTETGIAVTRALGAYLGDQSQSLIRLVADETGANIAAHALRVYRYPGLNAKLVESEAKDEAYIRIGEHRDISLLTVLPKASSPGLQIQARDGTWHNIRAPEGSMIVMAGEMLEHMTRGLKDAAGHAKEIYAPLHRVVGNAETITQDRFTAPFFFNADLRQPVLSLVDQKPLVIRGVTLNPGLRLIYEHIKSSTKLSDTPFEEFAADFSKIGEKIRATLAKRGMADKTQLTC